MMERLREAFEGEDGQATVEYGLVLAAILIAVAAAIALFGQAISGMFARLIELINNIGG